MANPYRPYLDDEENDPLSPYIREEQAPEMPPPVDFSEQPEEPTQPTDRGVRPLPSNILPFQSLPNPSLEAYQQHIASMPQREDYAPGTGRKILSAIAGGLAGLRGFDEGNKVVHEIQDAPYDEASRDWTSKGKAIEAAATLEGKTLGTSIDYHLSQIKDTTQRATLEARKRQIQNNYEVGMKNAATAEERAAVLKAAQQEAAKYHQDLIGVAKGRVAAEVAAERAKKGTATRLLSSLDALRTDRVAWDVVLSEMPEAKDFIETDDNGKIIGWTDAPTSYLGGLIGHDGWTPEQAQKRAMVIKRYNELRQERINELTSRHITGEPGPGIYE